MGYLTTKTDKEELCNWWIECTREQHNELIRKFRDLKQ